MTLPLLLVIAPGVALRRLVGTDLAFAVVVLVPALIGSRTQLHEAMRQGDARMSGGQHRLRVVLVVAEVALALFLDTWWPIILLVPVVVAINEFVIKREERYLTRRFGDEYKSYTTRVRRWL